MNFILGILCVIGFAAISSYIYVYNDTNEEK